MSDEPEIEEGEIVEGDDVPVNPAEHDEDDVPDED